MQILSLGWEDPLREEEMATHSILAWRVPSTEEPGRLQSMGSHRVNTAERAHMHDIQMFTFLVIPNFFTVVVLNCILTT